MTIALNLNQPNFDDPTQWPTVSAGPLSLSLTRLWDTGVTWRDIETSAGKYVFTELDKQITIAMSHGVKEVIYTMGKTPTFYGGGSNGATPPTDNTKAVAFALAVVNHVKTTFPTLVLDWEQWNEPNVLSTWNGTVAQLLALTQAVYAALHPLGIKVLCPPGSGGTAIGNFILSYLTACQNVYPFDVFTYHAYLGDGQRTANVGLGKILEDIKVKKGEFGINMPTWITEGSWGTDAQYSPPLSDTEKSAYVSTYDSMFQAAGVEVWVWYAWNNSNGFGVLATGQPPVANAAGLVFASFLTPLVSRTTQFSLPVAPVMPAPVHPPSIVPATIIPAPVQPPAITPPATVLTLKDATAKGVVFKLTGLTLTVTDAKGS